jgi:site-specific DNA recombinase
MYKSFEPVNKSTELACQLTDLWNGSDYLGKQKLQYLIFPEGIFYNKKKDECRTEKVNSVFRFISGISREYTKNKDGLNGYYPDKSVLVAGAGLEPTTFGL